MDHDAQQEREYARQLVVEKAVDAADRNLLDNSDGSTEMTNRLTAEVARHLFYRAIQPLDVDQLCMSMDEIAGTSVDKAMQVLNDECPEDSDAVRNSLLFLVALRFIEKVGIVFSSALMRWEFEHPATTK